MKKVARINNDSPNRKTYVYPVKLSHPSEYPLPVNVKTAYLLSDRDRPTAPSEYAESFPDEAVELSLIHI